MQKLLYVFALLSLFTTVLSYSCTERCFGSNSACKYGRFLSTCCVVNDTYDYCVTKGRLGDPCDTRCQNCINSYVCLNGFCSFIEEGCPCTTNKDCDPTGQTLLCVRGHCTTGEACLDDAECPAPLGCTNGYCQGAAGLGENCTFISPYFWIRDDDCHRDLFCDADNFVCVPRFQEGEECLYDQQCLKNLCTDFYCNSTVEPDPPGIPNYSLPNNASCSQFFECKSAFCNCTIDCVCDDPVDIGQICTDSVGCKSNYCGDCDENNICKCIEYRSKIAGETCSTDQDCVYGTFCSVLKRCLEISSLNTPGALCESDTQCGVNLKCSSEVQTPQGYDTCQETRDNVCTKISECASSERCLCDPNNSTRFTCQFQQDLYNDWELQQNTYITCGALKHYQYISLLLCPPNWENMPVDEIPDTCHKAVALNYCCLGCRGYRPEEPAIVDCKTERIISMQPNISCCGSPFIGCYLTPIQNCDAYLAKYNSSNSGTVNQTIDGNTTTFGLDAALNSKGLSSSSIAIIITVVVGVTLIVAAIGAKFAIVAYRKKKANSKSTEDIPLSTIKAKTLQDIVVLESIGSGSFSQVYKGVWQGTTTVALKKPVETGDFSNLAKEVSILVALSHRCIVQFLGVFENNYIVVEYMNKGSLSSILRASNNFTLSELLEMIKDVASGMIYLSEQNIIHRDLALRNLLVCAKGTSYQVKIADFGMSRYGNERGYYKTDDQTFPVKWCAPEVLNYGKFSVKSDVWSFGVTVWEILSFGAIPWIGLSNNETVETVLKGNQLTMPANCPENLWNLVKTMWMMDPSERPGFKDLYASITEVEHSLIKFSSSNYSYAHSHSNLDGLIDKETKSNNAYDLNEASLKPQTQDQDTENL